MTEKIGAAGAAPSEMVKNLSEGRAPARPKIGAAGAAPSELSTKDSEAIPMSRKEERFGKEAGFEGSRGIPNEQLTEADIPPPNADWLEIVRFALTWDGYIYWGSFEKCAEIANTWAQMFEKEGKLPNTLEELRTCVFFEWRRWRHLGDPPPKEVMHYIWALIEAIRQKVRERQLSR